MLHLFVSPSAVRRLEEARGFVRRFPPSTEVLLIGSNRTSVDDLAREIAAESGATFGLHRFSFVQLLARLAGGGLAASGLAPATPLGVEAVAARVTFALRRSGAIERLEPVSRYPGFSQALAATLTELRLEGTAPAALRQRENTREVGALLERFEEEIADAGIADRASLTRLAIEGLAAHGGDALGTAPILLLDVGISSSLDAEFLRALVGGARVAFATLPEGDRETLEALRAWGPADLILQPGEPMPPLSGLERLQSFLFAEESPPKGERGEDVQFFSAPGEGRECVEIARRVLDEARGGVPFDEIAIFLRAPELYAGLMETALRRAEIPAYFARGARRPDPSGRAFLALLACRSEGFSARRFAEYLSFAEVPELDSLGAPPSDRKIWVGPDEETLGAASEAAERVAPADRASNPAAHRSSDHAAERAADLTAGEQREVDPSQPAEDLPAVEGALRAPWKWEELLVEAAVIGGTDRWQRRLAGLDNELRVRMEEIAREDPESPRLPALQRELTNLGHLARFALPVIESLRALPEGADWGTWLRELTELCPKVLRRPERVLAILAELAPMGPIGPVSIEEVRCVLTERLSTLEREPPVHRYGQVFVATPEQARGRRFRVVFVPGLAERIFPQHPREDPLLLDGARRDLSEGLKTQEDRGIRERLLLRLAAGAATGRIYLSYPRIEVVEGRPRVPSFYGLDVARATCGAIPDFEELERDAANLSEAWLSWPAPSDPDRAIDPVEHDLAVLGPLVRAPAASAKGRARYLFELNEHLARSLRARWMRWQRRWYPADGIIRKSDAAQAALAGQGLKERIYSVTALQKFATCPYQFLLSAICGLGPREQAVALVELDPLTRGRIYHHVQADTLATLSRAGALPIRPLGLAEATLVLDASVSRLASSYREELAPAIARVWEDEIESMRADLRTWMRALAADPGGWAPLYFEFGFGLPHGGALNALDARSRLEPVALPGGFRLRGSVDLIEERKDGTLRVTDHKTGANRTAPGLKVGGGEILQPVLYSLAVEAALERSVSEARLFFATARGGFSERVVPIDAFTRHYASTVLETIDRAIAACVLPPAPRKEACRWCDFRPVCGPGQEERSARKERRALKDLEELRSLP